VARPFWNARDNTHHWLQTLATSLSTQKALREENDALREQIQTLRRENFLLPSLQKENEVLRTLLGRNDSTDGYIPVAVLVPESYAPHDSFILDAGTEQGVREHMIVMSPEGIALGYVQKALTRSAIVVRFSATHERISALVFGSTTTHITLEGQGSGSMQAQLPRDVSVTVGDPLVLSGIPTHPLGTVVHISLAPEDAFQTIHVASPENVTHLPYVLVDTVHMWDPPELPAMHPDSMSVDVDETES